MCCRDFVERWIKCQRTCQVSSTPYRKRHAGIQRLAGSRRTRRSKNIRVHQILKLHEMPSRRLFRVFKTIIVCQKVELLYKTHHFRLLLNSSPWATQPSTTEGKLCNFASAEAAVCDSAPCHTGWLTQPAEGSNDTDRIGLSILQWFTDCLRM